MRYSGNLSIGCEVWRRQATSRPAACCLFLLKWYDLVCCFLWLSIKIRGLVKREVLWGCGSAVLSLQWLSWFSPGSFGSVWLSLANTTRSVSVPSAILENVGFLVLAFILVKLSKTIRSLNDSTWLLPMGTFLLFFGNLINMATCFGLVPLALFVVGSLCARLGLSLLVFGWGEYYCAVGLKSTCAILAVGYMLAATLFALLNVIGESSMVLAAAIQLALIPLSHFLMQKGWGEIKNKRLLFNENSSFRIRTILPYLVAIFAFGFTAGALFALADSWSGVIYPFVWTAATVTASIIILVVVLLRTEINFISCFRSASIPLLIGLLLAPLFWKSSFGIVCFILYAAYSSVSIFNQIACVSLAQTKISNVLPLVVCSVAAEAMGIFLGKVTCGITFIHGPASFETVYLIALTLSTLLFVTFRSKSLSKLFGLNINTESGEAVEARCEALALDASLTSRETEILIELAKGRQASEIAEKLVISVATVRTHVRNIYKKTNIHSQTELVRKIVYREGF